MPIYDKPTKTLMAEWAQSHLEAGKVFSKREPVAWFKGNYPDLKPNTVKMHVEGMSVNNRIRRHHANIKPGSGHDLFYKIGTDKFRLWDESSDPPARYKPDIEREEDGETEFSDDNEVDPERTALADNSFAYERDLQNYLVRNLYVLEDGLKLFEDEELNGIEYDAGGRFIDILALDASDNFVVIELKVSRGYDRVIGQLLRYVAWVERNLAEGKTVRGFIVANDISEDLKLATSSIPNVKLFEYELAFQIDHIEPL